MTRKLLLASHGHYASGILSALEKLIGKTNKVSVLDCYVTEDFDLQAAAQAAVRNASGQDLIIATDIFGGSVNNEFMKYLSDDVYLVAGMNLPFLLELMAKFDTDMSTTDLIKDAMTDSQDSLRFCNDIELSAVSQDEDF